MISFNRLKFNCLIILSLFTQIDNLWAQGKISLNLNQSWQFRQSVKTDWFPAKVPGCVHTDLMDNNLIPDPYFGDNEKKVQWIENEDWEYRTNFDVSQNLLGKKVIELTFNGLDTYADVYFNDSLALKADNMYRSWTINAKNLLRLKNNNLRVIFHSAVNEGLRKAAFQTYRLPNHNEKTYESKKCGSQTRKSPYQFGWDTHPRLLTCGIWRPIIITGYDLAKIENVFIEPIKNDLKQAEFKIHTEINVNQDKNYKLEIFLHNSNQPAATKAISLKKGTISESIDFTIQNPKLWWPNGMGNPNLYLLKVVLSDEKGAIDAKTDKIGVRTIEVVREKDSIGRSFYFRVNGVPLFIKGSNHVPPDALVTKITDKQYESLIQAAKESNINMLRVWGGAIYENDIFYDLCAENGILIWQDFMYACSMYPGDNEFINNIEQETIENVKRLRNNPALAIWCGNNELISGWYEWGWPRDPKLNITKTDSVRIFHDYLKIFNEIIPNVIQKYNPQTFYWPCSPGSEPGIPSSLESGDLHYYFVWYGSSSIQTYKKVIPRFMSEYGVQSLPSYFTLQKYLDFKDMDLFSPVMTHRQKSVMPWITKDMDGNIMLMRYIREDYNEPKDFQSLVYLSQLFQADAIKIATEAHRINKPRCMGTMFWQFGDAWPNIGWSVIDYLGKKKAGFYTTKKVFKNISVIPYLSDTSINNSTLVNVFVNSDSMNLISGKLIIKLLDFQGKLLFMKELDVKIESFSNESYFNKLLSELLKGLNKNEVVLSAQLWSGKKLFSENLLYFDHPKLLMLIKPKIKYKITQTKNGFNIELTSNTLAKSVFLSLPNGDDNFSDNFFDLLPGGPINIRASLKTSTSALLQKFKILTYNSMLRF